MFPISRDPPEGGTVVGIAEGNDVLMSFQFLGIPPKGEHLILYANAVGRYMFPISRDPPEGGTAVVGHILRVKLMCFQFLGIPPKGEHLG